MLHVFGSNYRRFGMVVGSSQVAMYYMWWKGLHQFCGQEGAALFMIRPSFETPIVDSFGFKITNKAVIQTPTRPKAD